MILHICMCGFLRTKDIANFMSTEYYLPCASNPPKRKPTIAAINLKDVNSELRSLFKHDA